MDTSHSSADGTSSRRTWVPSRAQVAIFSPDGFGLGHFRRSMLIAERLVAEPTIDRVVVITGSPVARRFATHPAIDVVTLPAVTKDARGRYRSGTDDTPIPEVFRARGQAAADAVRHYRPDLLLVDHSPTGLDGELREMLADLEHDRRRPALVLGMREIIDDVDTVRAEWERTGAFDAIANRYDHVLVYGDPAVETTAVELGLDRIARGRVEHVGYVARPMPPRRCTDSADRPRILVTVGGGGDGRLLLDAYADALGGLGRAADFTSIVLTGPMLSSADRRAIGRSFAATRADVELIDFTPSPEPLLASATGVIAMAGYNTVTELMSLGAPALVVPREFPRREQRLRAERLGDVGAIDWELAEHLSPRRLQAFVDTARRSCHHRVPVRLDGLSTTVDAIVSMVHARREHGSVRPLASAT